MSRLFAALATFGIVVSSFAVNAGVALAHERRNVGPYTLVVGWINEPAYVNAMNALDLAVTETEGGKAVDGLAQTLTAELAFGGSTQVQPLPVAARFGMPGRYQSFVLPTRTGDYKFRIFGTIGATTVNETFESGPGRFGSVESTDALQYPARLVSTADLAARLDQIQTLVIAGIVLGGIALLLSLSGLALRRR
jgi:hypothetical protein